MSAPPATKSALLVAYYRVSTQRQGRSGLGLEAQQTAVAAHAARASATVAAEYIEVESGRNCSRPKIKEALARARAEGATLVVAKLDRLSRDVRFILELVDGGVPLLFLDMPDLPTGDPITARLILTVMGAIAEFESRRIGQRTREALARRRARLAALGQTGAVHTNPATAKTLRRKEHQQKASAAWHAANRARAAATRRELRPLALGLRQTMTLAGVAAELNARAIPTARRRAWTPGLVHHLLRPDPVPRSDPPPDPTPPQPTGDHSCP